MQPTNTAVERWIRDVLAGGWRDDGSVRMAGDRAWAYSLSGTPDYIIPVEEILLDKTAWEACGKTRGWEDEIFIVQANLFMIALMSKNLSIESALTALED